MTERRLFLYRTGLLLGLTSPVGTKAALADSVAYSPAAAPLSSSGALKKLVGLAGRSQEFFEIRHQQEFIIPLSVLVTPPPTGYSVRSSTPVRGQTDFEGLRNRTDAAGRPLDLSGHAHTVSLSLSLSLSLSADELSVLARGGNVTINLAQFGHTFYFVADDSTLAAVAALRGQS